MSETDERLKAIRERIQVGREWLAKVPEPTMFTTNGPGNLREGSCVVSRADIQMDMDLLEVAADALQGLKAESEERLDDLIIAREQIDTLQRENARLKAPMTHEEWLAIFNCNDALNKMPTVNAVIARRAEG